MLRKIRTAVAIAVIAILTFGFIDIAGIVDNPLLQKIQFGPALLSLSIVTLVCQEKKVWLQARAALDSLGSVGRTGNCVDLRIHIPGGTA